MKRHWIMIFAAAAALSCTSLSPEEVDIVSLGIAPDDIVVGAGAGEDGVKVLSDRDYRTDILSGGEWLSIGTVQRDSLSFSFSENKGFRRSAFVKVSTDGREDVLQVKQEGVFHEKVSLSEHELSAPVEGLEGTVRLHTNMPSDVFRIECSHPASFKAFGHSDYVLHFHLLPTTNRDKRTYQIKVSCTDGWGEEVSDCLNIVQDAFE